MLAADKNVPQVEKVLIKIKKNIRVRTEMMSVRRIPI